MNSRRIARMAMVLCLLLSSCTKRTQRIIVQPPPPPASKAEPPPPPEPPVPNPAPVRSQLELGDDSFATGSFAEAALSYESYLAANVNSSDRDKALFKLGLAYVFADRSPQNIAKAQDQFRLLMRQFPKSRYRPEAEYILSLQTELDKAQSDLRKRSLNARERNEKIKDMTEKIKDRDEKIRQLTEELDRMKKIDLERRPSRQPN